MPETYSWDGYNRTVTELYTEDGTIGTEGYVFDGSTADQFWPSLYPVYSPLLECDADPVSNPRRGRSDVNQFLSFVSPGAVDPTESGSTADAAGVISVLRANSTSGGNALNYGASGNNKLGVTIEDPLPGGSPIAVVNDFNLPSNTGYLRSNVAAVSWQATGSSEGPSANPLYWTARVNKEEAWNSTNAPAGQKIFLTATPEPNTSEYWLSPSIQLFNPTPYLVGEQTAIMRLNTGNPHSDTMFEVDGVTTTRIYFPNCDIINYINVDNTSVASYSTGDVIWSVKETTPGILDETAFYIITVERTVDNGFGVFPETRLQRDAVVDPSTRDYGSFAGSNVEIVVSPSASTADKLHIAIGDTLRFRVYKYNY